MCGVSGYLDFNYSEKQGRNLLESMNKKLAHRGPDGSGVLVNSSYGFGLGHTRLSIVGHGKTGSQPMISDSHRYVISFNGEIYNFRDLRIELKQCGKVFKGYSDTEVLLNGLEEWGLVDLLKRLNGMFALAYFDKKNKEMVLVRDRIGEKPMYVGYGQNGHIAFASEIPALAHLVRSSKMVNTQALANLVSYNYISAPDSIFSNVYKLQPGFFIKFCIKNNEWVKSSSQPWWQYTGNNLNFIPQLSRSTVKCKLIEILEQVISEQGEADVPIGALLSGGIDSTLVTAIHQKNSKESIQTFTVAFSEEDFDESAYARDIADQLGTKHTEVLLTSEEALEIIPNIAGTYGEPFADSSQIATMAICSVASKYISAVLTGDGADEVFGGYNRYLWAPRIWQWKQKAPGLLSDVMVGILSRGSQKRLSALQTCFDKVTKIPQIKEKISKVGWALNASSKSDLYQNLITGNIGIDFVKNHSSDKINEYHKRIIEESKQMGMAMMEVDLTTYLPEDILVKVDRASMRYGLETRAPYIDRRVVEFMSKVSEDLLLDKKKGKILLRDLLNYYLPKKIQDRPKTGFAVPIGIWLRGPLREWAEKLLAVDRLETEGFFEVEVVRNCWKDHLDDVVDASRPLWSILIFQSWLDSIDIN